MSRCGGMLREAHSACHRTTTDAAELADTYHK